MKTTKLLKKWTGIFYLICLFILFYLRPKKYELLNDQLIFSILIVYLFAVIIHFLSNDKSNWLRLDVFFILGFSIVHIQWPMMFAFSEIIPDDYWRIFVDDQLVNYTTWLSALGGVFFLMGFALFKGKKKKIGFIPKYNYRRLLYFTVFNFIIFLVFAGSSFLTGGVYKGDGGSAAGEGISVYFALFYNIGVISTTAIIIYQNKDQYKGNLLKWFLGLDKTYLILVFIYIILFLGIGDRGGPLALILTILILIGSFVRPFKFYEVGLIIVVGGLLMTIIGLGRSESSGLDILSAGADKYSNNSTGGYDTTLELANSYRTLNTAMANVPKEHDYFYGSLWMADILAPIPFAQSLYLEVTDKKSYEIGSGTYITYLVHGNNPSSGEGTTLIADIYMNFGLIGVVFFMSILGIFFKKLSVELDSPSKVKWLLIVSVFAGISLYYSRSSYLSSLRDIIWGIVLLRLFIKKKKIK